MQCESGVVVVGGFWWAVVTRIRTSTTFSFAFSRWQARPLHETTSTKRHHVLPSEREPLAVGPAVGETLVPVPFNAYRIVRADRVHELGSLGKLQLDLESPTAEVVGLANLVVLP